MAMWQPYKPYKAKPHERQKKIKVMPAFPQLCRICGKPTHNGSNTCNACQRFLDDKKHEEQTEGRRINEPRRT